MNIKQQITESIATSHRTVIIKSRQVGMTSIALDIALAEASTKKNFVAFFFARTKTEANLLFNQALNQLAVPHTSPFKGAISFNDFGTIYFFPAYTDRKLVLGKVDRIDLAVIDEAAFIKNLEFLLEPLYPVLKKLILISNPYLREGVFYNAISSDEESLESRLKTVVEQKHFDVWTNGGWTKIAVYNPDPAIKERCNLTQEQWNNEFGLEFININ